MIPVRGILPLPTGQLSAVASRLLIMSPMDKSQDADLEKGYETIEDASVFFADDDRVPVAFDDDDDLFEMYPGEESEYEFDSDGAFLD